MANDEGQVVVVTPSIAATDGTVLIVNPPGLCMPSTVSVPYGSARWLLFGPRCKVVLPRLTVVAMRMQHDRHAALHRIEMNATAGR